MLYINRIHFFFIIYNLKWPFCINVFVRYFQMHVSEKIRVENREVIRRCSGESHLFS